MKNRKLLAVTLPLFAATTVVGSGFAAWYFGQEAVDSNTLIGVHITDGIALGKLEIKYTTVQNPTGATFDSNKNSIRLVLDQGYQGLEDTNKGIYFEVSANGDFTDAEVLSTIEYSYTMNNEEFKKLDNAGYAVTISSSITIKNDLLEYVTVKSTGDGTPSYEWATNGQPVHETGQDKDTYTFSNVLADGTSTVTQSFDFSSEADTGVGNYMNNKFLEYKANTNTGETSKGKPKTETELGTMRANLVDKTTIDLNFHSEITQKEQI